MINSIGQQQASNEILFKENQHVTLFEDLSNEIIYEIIDFLDYYHAYHIFFDLNIRFRNLFIHSSISLNLNLCKISKRNFDRYFQLAIKPNRNYIKSLYISNRFYINYFLSLLPIDSSFIHLKSLSLNGINSNKLISFLTVLSSLPNLTSLIITVHGHIQEIHIVHQLILNLPVLTYCNTSLNWQIQNSFVPLLSKKKSSIKHLVIDGPYNFLNFSILLSCMPDLTRLTCYQLFEGNDNDFQRPIILSKLTHLHLVLSIPFHQFQKLILNLEHSLKVLCISSMPLVNEQQNLDHVNNDYIDADRWEPLISIHMPHLQHFDLRCFGKVDQLDINYHQTYQILINKFDSIFWITRGWIFAYQFYDYDSFTWLVLSSIHSHISKKNDLHKYSKIETSIQTTHQIIITNPMSFVNYTCRLSHHGQLTLSGISYNKNLSCISQLNNLIPITQLTELTLNCDSFLMDQLINLLQHAYNLQRLTLLARSRCVTFDNETINRYVTDDSNGTQMPYRGLLALKHVETILKISSRLQSLEMNINENFLEQIVRFILLQHISKTRQLCLLGLRDAHYGMIRRLNRMLNIENLIESYTIEYIYNTLYLWW